uniref:Uncharacterized protein n=1 Tax=Globodera rostochiensis TaxID=31243 RepID=A0A914HJD1_GLORO
MTSKARDFSYKQLVEMEHKCGDGDGVQISLPVLRRITTAPIVCGEAAELAGLLDTPHLRRRHLRRAGTFRQMPIFSANLAQ